MVERIEESNDFIYIYISAVAAYIVPKRAFKDSKDKEIFMDTLKIYIRI